MTAEEYGPVALLAIWEQQYKEPLYLVTNLSDLAACGAQLADWLSLSTVRPQSFGGSGWRGLLE